MSLSSTKSNNETIEWLLYKWRQLGWQGYLGLLLMLSAMFLLVVLIPAKLNVLTTLNLEKSKLGSQNFNLEQVENEQNPVDVINDFYAILPLQDEANNKIAEILEAAKAAGLVSNKTQYTPQDVPASAMVKYEINIPVSGSYIQIRQFINTVLNAHPSLALKTANFHRRDINNSVVEADIQMTLYLHTAK